MTTPIIPITPILTERNERGHHIVGNQPLQWWKFIFDAKSPTWTKYGAVAFVEGRTETEARTAAIKAGQAEFPQSEILPIAIGLSTAEAAQLYAAKKQRHAVWLENTQHGIPNDRATLDPAGVTPSDQGAPESAPQSSSTLSLPPSTEPEAIRALIAKWRSENGDYPESKQDCADELEALVRASSPPEPEAETPSRIITERLIANAAARRASSLPPPVSPPLLLAPSIQFPNPCFVCPEHGPTIVDEDGCCRTCGADAPVQTITTSPSVSELNWVRAQRDVAEEKLAERNMSNPVSRAFWEFVSRTAAEWRAQEPEWSRKARREEEDYGVLRCAECGEIRDPLTGCPNGHESLVPPSASGPSKE